jgi:predicted transcriptional regulator
MGLSTSYVEANKIAADDLPSLIRSTYAALVEADQPAAAETGAVPKPTPAQIRRSITPDALISFIDGKPYKVLKRHLTTQGLTPQMYQERYGLPSDYPLTAPNYSAARSAWARKVGLGQKVAPAPAKRAVKAAPKAKGKKAGPRARVPKAVRSPKGTG